MSMLDTIGGLYGGLGGSGGVGGQIPGNASAASAAANVTADPSTYLGQVGGGYTSFGPFNVNFPGVESQGADSINSPNLFSSVVPKGMLPIVAIVGVVLLFILLRK